MGGRHIAVLTAILIALCVPLALIVANDAQQRHVQAAINETLAISDKPMPEAVEAADDAQEVEDELAAEEEAAAYIYYAPSSYYDSQYDDMSDQEYIAWRESGADYDARNGRYIGKYQMDESRLGGDWSPEHQEEVAEQYMLDRYGSWEAAREFWDSHGWW